MLTKSPEKEKSSVGLSTCSNTSTYLMVIVSIKDFLNHHLNGRSSESSTYDRIGVDYWDLTILVYKDRGF